MKTDQQRWHASAFVSVLVGLCSSLIFASAWRAGAAGGKLSVAIVDAATGQPIAAAVRLYDAQQHLLVPDNAIDLQSLGYLYEPGALIHYADWTSSRVRSRDPHFGSSYFRQAHSDITACAFVSGGFNIDLPPGHYRLIVNRGLEYAPVERSIVIDGVARRDNIRLSRWVDMASRGWYSGDAHVHAQRSSAQGNRIPLDWAAAEDVHLINVLAMGDAEQTYYAQYAFGRAGVATMGDTALLPGQEEPRTQYLGHTLHLNTAELVRDASRYYDYPAVFSRVRKGGGLSGFAHVGRRRWSFHADDGLSLLAPSGLVDFVEVAQMGYIGVNSWYEFLNIGFRLTAMAGSDVPWGGTIGNTRVYAYTGPASRLNPGQWLEAVRKGRTFVTTGPMLEFSVNGQPPGSIIRLKKGEKVRVSARAWGEPPGTIPIQLEVVSFGRALKSVVPGHDGDRQLVASLDLEPERSMWVTARCRTHKEPFMDAPGFFSGAIATPVYVEVDGEPCRDVDHLPELIARRIESLDRIESWIRSGGEGMARGSVGGFESAAAMRASVPALKVQVDAARAYYRRGMK